MKLAAKIFRLCLLTQLELPYGGNLVPSQSADVLAREFHDGVAGLLRILEDESRDSLERDRPYMLSLHQMLMEVWVSPADTRHLKAATGKTRAEWLAAPLWNYSAELMTVSAPRPELIAA
ncbi:hypothetical protein G3A43_07910 [Paraburkholderia aspalathi]|nr:hypothetical protein [Paraburkholderia aspalathi]MBK3780180.1 hypothetical protein [Paraburkholderia aspalathi]